MSKNLFDDVDEDSDDEGSIIEDSDRDVLMQILDNAKLKYTESDNDEFEDIIVLKNGVGFAFDEDGGLLYVIQDV